MGDKLATLDNLFLQLESEATPMHVGGLLVFAGDGADRYAEMTRAPVRAEPFDRVLVPAKRFGGMPSWRRAEAVALDDHLTRIELTDDATLTREVSRIHGQLLARDRPMWSCHLFTGLPDRYAYFYRVHHSLVDGISAIRRMQSGLSSAPDEATPPLWAHAPPRKKRSPRPQPGLFSAARTQLGVVAEIAGALRKVAASRHSDEPRAAVPFSAPPIRMNRTITSGERSVAWQRLPFEAVRRIGKAAGATINEVLLAVFAGVMRADLVARGDLPAEPLVSMVPLSLRELGDEGGNRLTCLLCNLGTHLADPVARLSTIVASSTDGKRMLREMSPDAAAAYALVVMFPGIAATLLGFYENFWLPFNVVISNVPGPREPLYDNGARLEAIYPLSLLYDREGINITVISYQDELDVGLVATVDAVPDAPAMAAAMLDELALLERAVLG